MVKAKKGLPREKSGIKPVPPVPKWNTSQPGKLPKGRRTFKVGLPVVLSKNNPKKLETTTITKNNGRIFRLG